ncbi:hypothetical protein ACP0GC_10880 [Escherichia coli]|uniref:hypothetical protein n=1 Tax=Escherichia coli TaxID=562 RepID=UPI003CF538ED
MKLFNVITFCCAIFAGSAIADNKLPDWLSTSKKDYDLVRAFYLSGFASKAMNNQFGYHLPSELVNDFKDNEFAAQEKWNTIPIVYGEIKSIRMVNNKPIVELFTPGENATPLNYMLNLQSKCNKKRSTHQLEYNFVSTQKPFPNDKYFLPTSYNKRARKDNDFTRTGQKTSRNCQSTGT